VCLPCRNKTPKDQRVLQQQRSVIMNSEDCIAKYTGLLTVNDGPKHRPLLEAAAQHKRDATAAEKVRIAALSPYEKKANKKAVREARLVAKALRHDVAEVVVVADDNTLVGGNVDASARVDTEINQDNSLDDDTSEGDHDN